ncbi:helix-turn-helix domain-containing protein [Parapedobacter tibetensis]|uniref:helix-turn-helix domain-containing protein n=1 Tax=Parapedobacter tibetensis TaxID=2972951 RepID=UPI00214D76C2|nr:hypothetical protein [Parapedobacter tibetensis]
MKRRIATNLAKIRNLRRHSQDEIAEVLSISQQAYWKMEEVKTRISAVQLGHLAHFYQVSVDVFFEEKPDFNENIHTSKTKLASVQAQLEKEQFFSEMLQHRNRELSGELAALQARIAELEDETMRLRQRLEAGDRENQVFRLNGRLKGSMVIEALVAMVLIAVASAAGVLFLLP